MSSHPVPSGRGRIAIPLAQVRGKGIQHLHVFQSEEALNLDIEFEDGLVLELYFRVGFQASANVLEYRNGDSRVLKTLKLKTGT